jgi:hypothetical protein
MAYIGQENKKIIIAKTKDFFNELGLKVTFKIHNHSSLHITIREGKTDFLTMINKICKQIRDDNLFDNAKYYKDKETLENFRDNFSLRYCDNIPEAIYLRNLFQNIEAKIKQAGEWYDNSDSMSDYFDTKFYYHIAIGDYDKPYKFIA